MTVWTPDTCGCQIEFSDDGNLTFIRTIKTCGHHATGSGTPTHLSNVLKENRQKNDIVIRIAGNDISIPNHPGVHWSVSNASSLMTVRGTTIAQGTINFIRANYPQVDIAVDGTVPLGEILGAIVP